jgi:hypothetical protein
VAVNTFGVTYSTVQSLWLPQIPGFSALTKPTSTAVTTMVSQAAAELEGKLYGEDITASSITDTASAAYIMCSEQLGRMTALRVLKVLSQQFPELAKEYARQAKAWFDELAAKGGTFLGNDDLQTGDSDPDGPTTHISQYGLTTDSAASMSTTIPRLRRDDDL